MGGLLRNFDLKNTPIPRGLSVIEASAGTGKTWTISHLLPRLLIDGAADNISNVLLVTFTEDAARELGERTRRQLAILIAHASANTKPKREEGGISILLDRLMALAATERDAALMRLQLALDDIDQLCVQTIHGFCNKVLATETLLCGISAGFIVETNPTEMKSDAIKDTWRTDLAKDPLMTAVAAIDDWSVEHDLKVWNLLTQREGTIMEPPPLSLTKARQQVVLTLQELKQKHDGILNIEDIAARDGVRLNQSSKSPGEESITQIRTWHQLLRNMNPSRPSVKTLHVARRLTTAASWFARNTGTGRTAASDVVQLPIVVAAKAVDRSIRASSWAWLAHLRRTGQRRFERSLRLKNALTYSDLIQKLHHALCSGPNRKALSARLAAEWKICLIDESQDTDQQQLEIFRAIFDNPQNSNHLVLVGDPKQAIYSFRGGDLDAYLAARPNEESRICNLSTTYRAAHGLVSSLNCLFGRTQAFGNPDLHYHDAEAARQDIDLPLPKDGQGRLVAWLVPEESIEHWILSEPRRKNAAACTATAIVDLLNQSLGPERLKIEPSKVAVLTRTNLEAKVVYEALRLRNVPTVIRDDGDVMHGEMARDLSLLLNSVLSPTHTGWQRSTMATRLFGYNSEMLCSLTDDTTEQWLVSLTTWGELWRSRGISALMTELETHSEIMLRLASAPSGERHLTDLRHLGELLQAKETAHYRAPEKLLQWFEAERLTEASSTFERMYRLEEDSDAVQIVTVHSAKGLEFDFVFCPYLWSTMSAPRTHQPILVRRETSWTLSDGEQNNNHEAHLIAATDRLMEDLRLTYVALTRARRRVTFLAGPLGYSSRSALPPSSLDWLLRTEEQSGAFEDWYSNTARQKKNPSACEHGDTLQSLQAANPSVITVSAPPVATETSWTSNQHSHKDIHARPLPVLKFDAWQMTSFSKLAHGRQEERERQDAMLPTKSTDAVDITFEATDSIVPLANFPRGIRAGHCLHELLEHWDFQEDTEPIVKRSLRRYRLLSGKAEIDIRNTLEELKTVHLQHMDVDLKTAAADKTLSEWEFLLPLNHNGISGHSLSKVFNKHARNDTERLYALDLAGLPEQTLSGMLTGYIDRIIRANDVWGIADWKSNYLGSCYNQYRQEDLWNCAADQHYLLQVHLYLVALRRYLKERAPQDTATSGYLVFLRGISPKQEDGVLEISPPDGLLKDLDKLFLQKAIT